MPSGKETPKEMQRKIWRVFNIDKMFYSQAAKKLGVSIRVVKKYSKEEK